MKEKYQEWRPSYNSGRLINHINIILNDYEEQGYKLTLRQLYYQLVSKDIIPNSVEEYKKIGNIVNRGRLSGFIDWNMIEDRLRVPQSRSHWDNPKEIIETAAKAYYQSRWKNQDNYIEVWCEKDAISNIIEPICYRWDVTFMANRGYSSQSAMYEAQKRIHHAQIINKSIKIIYLGDHDPSGIDMTRDIKDRLGIFLNFEGISFEDVDRIALNMDQIDEFNPPENPAKITDSRFQGYADIYGNLSWELDALEPKVLENLVENKIKTFINTDLWHETEVIENKDKEKLNKIAEDFE